MMEIIVSNWGVVLIFVVAIVGLFELLIVKDKERARKWLLIAVLEAEKEFGSKTGTVKLRYVYDAFIVAFPVLSKFISFEAFSQMVDEVLVEMTHLINTNTAIFNYVGGYEEIKK